MATHSSILAWKIPWTDESGELQSMGLQRVRDNWVHVHHSNSMLNLLMDSQIAFKVVALFYIPTSGLWEYQFVLIKLLLICLFESGHPAAAACCCVASVVSNSVRPQRRQRSRLPRPWASPGKNTGVGCHFLLQCMKVKSESEVAQSCPTPSDPMDCSPPGSSIHGIFQARVLEWGAIAFSGY